MEECLSGTFAGVVQVLVGQPFDTIKVRLQTQPHLYSGTLDAFWKTIRPAPSLVAASAPLPQHLSALPQQPAPHSIASLPRTSADRGGLFALYRGTLSPLLGIGVCSSIQFGVLEAAKRAFTDEKTGKLGLPGLYAAGTLAGLANGIVAGPVEHVRVRLQVQNEATAKAAPQLQFNGTLDAYRQIWSRYGLRGLCKGQVPTFLREASGYGVYFTVYDRLMEQAAGARYQGDRKRVPKWELMLYGAMAGYALWFACFPFDVIKSKIQTDAFETKQAKYKGWIDCARQIQAAQGFKGFYAGLTPCLLRAAPVNAATFLAYETAKSFFKS